MDAHNQQHQPYVMPDFRHLMAGVPPPPELFPTHHRSPQPMDLMMVAAAASHPMKIHGRGEASSGSLHEFQTESSPAVAVPYDGGDGGSARWPRQETLTLLEIRSRLDARFREANQKGPLWDEVSRIMSEEHGYQRTGKKCREKFENLYKYYKKTKEGKAGRQDGKHYRFFRQLEALYGDNSSSNAPTAVYTSIPESQGLINSFGSYHPRIMSPHQLMNASMSNNKETTPSQKISDSLSLSGSSDFDTSDSSDGNNNSTGLTDHLMMKKRRSGRSWKVKIKEFIDSRMRKMIEKQEAWAEKMMRAMEEKEQERLVREEEWRRQEIARIDKEHKFWAKERAWIEARDAAIMEALRNLMSRSSSSDDMMSINNHLVTACLDSHEKGAVTETAKLGDVSNESNFLKKGKDYYERKRKEEFSRSDGNDYYPGDDDSRYNRGGVAGYNCAMINEQGSDAGGVRHHPLNVSSSPSNSNAGIPVQDSCFRFMMGDGGSLWENYDVKLNKGEN